MTNSRMLVMTLTNFTLAQSDLLRTPLTPPPPLRLLVLLLVVCESVVIKWASTALHNIANEEWLRQDGASLP